MSNAASFDGSTSLSRGASGTLDRVSAAASFTVAGWVYVNANTYYGILDNIGGNYSWYIIRHPVGGRASIQIYDGNGVSNAGVVTVASTSGIGVGAWHFVAFTYDGETKTVAGRLDTETIDGVVLTYGVAAQPWAGIFASNQAGFNRLVGRVDSWGVWNRVLSGSELDELYNGGTGRTYSQLSTGIKSGLGAFWDFETTGWIDSSGNGNTLTASDPAPTLTTGVGAPDPTIEDFAMDSSTPAGITFTAAISGGTGLKMAKLYRSVGPTDLEASWTLVDTVTGVDSDTIELFGTAPDERVYHWRVKVIDELTPMAGTAISDVLQASLWEQPVYIVDVGDSIIAGTVGEVDWTVGTTNDVKTIQELAPMIGPRSITLNSQAVASSYTAYFAVGGLHRAAYTAAVDAAAASLRRFILTYQLGINDGNNPYDPAVLANVLSCVNYAIAAGAICIIHLPTYSAASGETQFARDYETAIRSIINNRTIFLGSTRLGRITAAVYPTDYNDNDATHLNSTGGTLMARERASATARVINQVSSIVPIGGDVVTLSTGSFLRARRRA